MIGDNGTAPALGGQRRGLLATVHIARKQLGMVEDDYRAMLSRVTGKPPEMWGKAIVGFGRRHVRYANGRDLEWMEIGFSPRKANTSIYLAGGLDTYADLLARLGKHRTGGGCLYLKKVGDVDPAVLEELLARSVAHVRTSDG